jgi:hypothetical protein
MRFFPDEHHQESGIFGLSLMRRVRIQLEGLLREKQPLLLLGMASEPGGYE